jgi:nitrite reductase/ring-hydroxylating ferredoxin subunit
VVDAGACILECPWHGGRFDLTSGRPTAGPPSVPLKTYRVKIAGEQILVG